MKINTYLYIYIYTHIVIINNNKIIIIIIITYNTHPSPWEDEIRFIKQIFRHHYIYRKIISIFFRK